MRFIMKDVTSEKMSVKLAFTLIGKCKDMPAKHIPAEWRNSDTLNLVKQRVTDQFGARALHIINEDMLGNDNAIYPKFYAAGWFHSMGNPMTELVVVDHGNTMEAAQNALLQSVTSVPWDMVCAYVKA